MKKGKEFLENAPIIQEIPLVFRYIDPIEHYPMRQEGRRHHGILYVIEGREEYKMLDTTLHTEPGDVFYLPKSEKYDVQMFDNVCTVIVIEFETSVPLHMSAFQLRPTNSRLFMGYFTEIERCWQLKRAGWAMECMSMAYHIMAEMQRQILMKYSPSEKIEKIQPVVDYMHQHFDDPNVRVELLAEKCDYHPRYFAKVFREAYGVSPKQYLTQLRMERARELILSNRYTVSQVAQMTGFGEIYHFSKVFKQENGVSPTEYNRKWENHGDENHISGENAVN